MNNNSALKLKYGVDKTLSGLLLVLMFPLLVIFSAAILFEGLFRRESRGSVFVFDRRISEDQPFLMIKFRTYFIHDDPKHADKLGTTDFINDRAVTRVGSFLRKYYFDELPQLINILRGDMSFIGPRPVPETQYQVVLELGYQSKRVLRAGLGGAAQALKGQWINGLGGLDADERLIERYAQGAPFEILMLDLKNMWWTFQKVIEADGLEDPGR